MSEKKKFWISLGIGIAFVMVLLLLTEVWFLLNKHYIKPVPPIIETVTVTTTLPVEIKDVTITLPAVTLPAVILPPVIKNHYIETVSFFKR